MQTINITNSNVTINPTHIGGWGKKHFKRCIKIGKLRFYITWNYRLKNSSRREQERNHNGIVDAKRLKWAKTKGHCDLCGKKINKLSQSQVHHILAWWRFPEYEVDERNLFLLCPECHKAIHKNPFQECSMIKKKCREFGLDYRDYYKVL